MTYRNQRNTNWTLFLLILVGIVLGGFIGTLAEKVEFLKWMNYGMEFGLDSPVSLDLKVIFLAFQIKFYINITSILGTIIAVLIYRKL